MKANPRSPEQLHRNQTEEQNWCIEYGLNHKVLRDTHVMVDDILRRLAQEGYFCGEDTTHSEIREDLLKQCSQGDEFYFDVLKIIIGAAAFPHYYKINETITDEMKAQEMIKKNNARLPGTVCK